MGPREHQIKVRLNDQELARLDEVRGDEERAVGAPGLALIGAQLARTREGAM
jgi:hypothetical protein